MDKRFDNHRITMKYASYRPVYNAQLADRIMDYKRKHSVDPKAEIYDFMIDVGCGNGQSTNIFAGHFRKILAIDSSETQIEKANAQNKYSHIKYEVGVAENIAADDQSVDLLVSGEAAHWFKLPTFLSEVKRVLKPDGFLAIFGYWTPILIPIGVKDCDDLGKSISRMVEDASIQALTYRNTLYLKDVFQSRYQNVYDQMHFKSKERHDDICIDDVWERKHLKGFLESVSSFDESTISSFDRNLTKLCGFEGEFDMTSSFSLFLLLAADK